MIKFIIRRLILLIPVLVGVSIIAFLMLHLAPGDPAELLAGLEASAEDVAPCEFASAWISPSLSNTLCS